MNTVPTQPTRPLPQYNPAVLVLDVQALLATKGIPAVVDEHTRYPAGLAAADLLRALHVQPSSSPEPPNGGHWRPE